ncbi:MAG: 50S ribosomal protein L4 [Candidatus Hodarchaeales archaeon]
MKASVFDLEGQEIEKIDLPDIFESEFRPDVIKRAVLASQSAKRQPYGPDPEAGKRTSAENWGTGRGVARLPRVKGSRTHSGAKAAFVGIVVGGAVTHPPRPRSFTEKINKKERLLAIRSGIAATADSVLVESRGHWVSEIPDIPLIVSPEFEQLKSTKEAVIAFSKLGLIRTPKDVETENPVDFGDINKAGRRMETIRSGKGKRRGRKYKNAKSVLFIHGDPDKDSKEVVPIVKSARNLPGVDICSVSQLNAELLAPGTHPGRLAVWSKTAIKQLEEKKLFYEKKESKK